MYIVNVMAIQKSKLWIHIIVDLIFIVAITIFVSFFAGKTAVNSFFLDTKQADKSTEINAKEVEEKINSNLEILKSYSEVITQNDKLSTNDLTRYLKMISKSNSSFETVGYITKTGEGFLYTEGFILKDQAKKFAKVLKDKNKPSIFTYNEDNQNSRIIFSIPVTTEDFNGWLFAISPEILPTEYYKELQHKNEKLEIYILNERNDVLIRSEKASESFKYTDIDKNAFITSAVSSNEPPQNPQNKSFFLNAQPKTNTLPQTNVNSVLENSANKTPKTKLELSHDAQKSINTARERIFMSQKNVYEHFSFDFDENERNEKEIIRIATNIAILLDNYISNANRLIWSEKTIHLTGGANWKILVGIPLKFSDTTIDTFVSTLKVIFITYALFMFLTISQLISLTRSNKRLVRMAFYDETIDWYNWKQFEQNAPCIFRRFSRQKRRGKNGQLAIVTFDIRKFRLLTDLSDSKGTNLILSKIGQILKREIDCKYRELFTRIFLDEFIMLVNYNTKEDLDKRIRKLEKCFHKEIDAPQKLNFAFGIYYIEDLKISVNKMKNYAGMAKDIAKSSSDVNIVCFNEEILTSLLHERDIENEMDNALENHDFKVYLQPKYVPSSQTVAGAEALVRWIHPQKGFISPGDFIPIFEKNMFVHKLDYYMLEEVCKIQKKWLDAQKELVVISVNISRSHLVVPSLVDDITAIIDKYKLPHTCIEIELTESAFFEDKNILLDTVKRLKEQNIHVSMDDFGSGYSSLNSLKDIPVDVLKLDAAFFRNEENGEDRGNTVVKCTIDMAKQLNIRIVAEGIETKEQVDFLASNGCDMIQGFYFAKPMPIDNFEKLMKYTEEKEES